MTGLAKLEQSLILPAASVGWEKYLSTFSTSKHHRMEIIASVLESRFITMVW